MPRQPSGVEPFGDRHLMKGVIVMFTAMVGAADGVVAAQAGSLVATLTVIGMVAVLVAIAGLQAVSMWRQQD